MKFPLDWLFLDRWYWITILGCCAVMIGPFFILYTVILLPGILRAVAVFGLLAGWIIAGACKDWAKSKYKEEKPPPS